SPRTLRPRAEPRATATLDVAAQYSLGSARALRRGKQLATDLRAAVCCQMGGNERGRQKLRQRCLRRSGAPGCSACRALNDEKRRRRAPLVTISQTATSGLSMALRSLISVFL